MKDQASYTHRDIGAFWKRKSRKNEAPEQRSMRQAYDWERNEKKKMEPASDPLTVPVTCIYIEINRIDYQLTLFEISM
jgi:hypothetical protein